MITVLHWGLHGWAFYVLAALAIAVYSYRHGLPLAFRTALFPVLGRRGLSGWPGRGVDLLASVGTVCGVATSMGLVAGAMNATLNRLVGLPLGTASQTAIVFAVAALGVASARSGVARGIRRLSEVNLWVSAGFLATVWVLGPSGDLIGVLFSATRDYAMQIVPVGVFVADEQTGQEWQAAWTVFYWGWWLAWTPFVSLFVARISRGRTVREFVLGVMGVPTAVILVWMSVIGGTALHQELEMPGSVSAAVNQDYSLGIVTVIDNLTTPEGALLLTAVAAFLLFTWLITSLDSATLVISHLVDTVEVDAAKVFWGLALAAVTCSLAWAGGVPALQAASIVIGLPLAGLVVLLGAGLLADLFRGRL